MRFTLASNHASDASDVLECCPRTKSQIHAEDDGDIETLAQGLTFPSHFGFLILVILSIEFVRL